MYHLVITVNPVLTVPIVIVPVMTSLYPVRVNTAICIGVPLLTIPVSPVTTPLRIRYHEVVLGKKLTLTGTLRLSALAV